MGTNAQDVLVMSNRVKNRNEANVFVMGGGSFRLSKSNIKHLTECPQIGVVPRTRQIQPHFIDLDLEYDITDDFKCPAGVDEFVDVAEKILTVFSQICPTKTAELDVVITRRPGPYKHKTKNCYKSGCHIICIGEFTKDEQILCRKRVLERHDLQKIFQTRNSSSDIYDNAVATRRNGCLIIGCRKPAYREVKPHYICYWNFRELGTFF